LSLIKNYEMDNLTYKIIKFLEKFEQINMLNAYNQYEFSKTAKAIISAGYTSPT